MNRKLYHLFLINLIFSAALFAQPGFVKHSVTTALETAKKLYVADIDNDGDLDIVAVASNSTGAANVAWYENDGQENFTTHVIASDYYTARGVYAGDLIPGGHLEIVATTLDNQLIAMWEYQGGNWVKSNIGSGTAPVSYAVRTADINNDGNLDIIASYGSGENRLLWFQGDGSGGFTERNIVISYLNAADIVAGYINDDNHLDVAGIAFSGDNVSWFENDGTPEDGGWIQDDVQSGYIGPNSVELVDMDNDGDLDILVAAWGANSSSSSDDRISWWENLGDGNFGSENLIIQPFWNGRNAMGADMDGDGDMDVIATADESNKISWFENDGSQNFTERVITSSFSYAYYVFPVDMDGDGDMDAVASAQNNNEVAWWENDLEDGQVIAAGDVAPVEFWGGEVVIDFSTGSEGKTTVFYNAGNVPERASLHPDIHHVATKGFYTITTRKTSYSAAAEFYYGAGHVAEWSAINDENDLVLCLWNDTNNRWEEAGTSQSVNQNDNKIIVSGLTDEFQRYSKWTLGSRTADNSLPVQLLAFTAKITAGGIELNWKTASEINNLGFEIWRAGENDSVYQKISDYNSNSGLIGAGNSNQEQYYRFTDRQVIENQVYFYKLVDVDFNHQKTSHGPLSVKYTPVPPVAEEPAYLTRFTLEQNYPNPFNLSTNIPVTVSGNALQGGQLVIYDVLGREIKTIPLDLLPVGQSLIHWDGTDNQQRTVTSGTYFYRLIHDRMSQFKRMTIVK